MLLQFCLSLCVACRFYGRDIRAYEILAGEVAPPEGCEALYKVMKEHQELAARAALKLAKRQAAKHADTARDRISQSTGFSLPVSGLCSCQCVCVLLAVVCLTVFSFVDLSVCHV